MESGFCGILPWTFLAAERALSGERWQESVRYWIKWVGGIAWERVLRDGFWRRWIERRCLMQFCWRVLLSKWTIFFSAGAEERKRGREGERESTLQGRLENDHLVWTHGPWGYMMICKTQDSNPFL